MKHPPAAGTTAPSRLPGLFITFEGPEGSGKSTQIKRLAADLEAAGRTVILTREPGGTPAGDRIRSILLDKTGISLEPETEVFLMLAQRTEHWRKVIAPAKARGCVILCDRYFDSSLAYQGYGRGIDVAAIRNLHFEFLGSEFLPDATVLFDLPPEKGLERVRTSGRGAPDRIDSEELAFHRRVREGYLAVAAAEPGRYLVIPADRDVTQVARDVTAALNARFALDLSCEARA